MMQVKMILVLIVALLTGFGASAKDRYIVIYKSTQGFTAMNSFMQLESSKAWGLQKSLPFIKGMVFSSSDELVMEKLKNHPEVLVVEKEKFYKSPRPTNGYLQKAATRQTLSAPFAGDVAQFQPTQGTPWGIKSVKAPEAWVVSPDAGAQSRILILDTGVDKVHEALVANFEKGRNFTGDDLSIVDENVKDSVGHGTHTSATAAASYDSATGFVGVSPRSKLLMGKVCDAEGCGSVSIATGINWGIQEKVDVISMSLGGGWASLGEQAAVKAAEAAGIFVVAASGNEAVVEPDGSISTPGVSYPAALPTVFAVGAVDSALVKSVFSNWGPELDISAPGSGVLSAVPTGTGRLHSVDIIVAGQRMHVNSKPFAGINDFTRPLIGKLVFAGFGKNTDFASIDVKGKLALISRGELSFKEKVINALNAGAVGAIIFNNAPGLPGGIYSEDETIDFPMAMIEQAEGQKIVEQLSLGNTVETEMVTLVTNYSAWDGTSMATPHVAGVAALAISAYKVSHPGKRISPVALRALLQKTATKLSPNLNNEYGAGLVQAGAAVSAAIAAP